MADYYELTPGASLLREELWHWYLSFPQRRYFFNFTYTARATRCNVESLNMYIPYKKPRLILNPCSIGSPVKQTSKVSFINNLHRHLTTELQRVKPQKHESKVTILISHGFTSDSNLLIAHALSLQVWYQAVELHIKFNFSITHTVGTCIQTWTFIIVRWHHLLERFYRIHICSSYLIPNIPLCHVTPVHCPIQVRSSLHVFMER